MVILRWTSKTITRSWVWSRRRTTRPSRPRTASWRAKYHPDVSKEKDAESKFKDASEAYEALKSADKRAEYDDLRKYGQHGQPFQGPPGWQGRGGFGGGGADTGDFSDFFSSIFGSRGNGFGGGQPGRSAGRRGQDVELELPIFLEESLSNESKKVSFQIPQHNAAGQHVSNTSKSLNVKIPAGVTDGERIRLKGQGAPGVGGGANGDLYLTIRFAPHPKFDVEGENLIITLPLAPWNCAGGGDRGADPDRQDQPQGPGGQPERPAHASQGPRPAEQGRGARLSVCAAQGSDAATERRCRQGVVAGTGEKGRLRPERAME